MQAPVFEAAGEVLHEHGEGVESPDVAALGVAGLVEGELQGPLDVDADDRLGHGRELGCPVGQGAAVVGAHVAWPGGGEDAERDRGGGGWGRGGGRRRGSRRRRLAPAVLLLLFSLFSLFGRCGTDPTGAGFRPYGVGSVWDRPYGLG